MSSGATGGGIQAVRGFVGWCATVGMCREDAITAACRAMTTDRLPYVGGRRLQAIVALAYGGDALPTKFGPTSFLEVQNGVAF